MILALPTYAMLPLDSSVTAKSRLLHKNAMNPHMSTKSEIDSSHLCTFTTKLGSPLCIFLEIFGTDCRSGSFDSSDKILQL